MLNNNDTDTNETWLPVEGYENIYWVSDLGRVKNSRKIMSPYKINSGYLCIDFTVNKVKQKNLVHRLVASTFIDNNDSLREVNHIDEDKLNNNVKNLQWCSSADNKQHSMQSGAYNSMYTSKNTLGKKHKSVVSKYHNVGWDKNRSKWTACVRNAGVNYHRKRFNTENEAALHVNWIIDKYGFTDRPKNIII